MAEKVYVIKCSRGIWDDYASWIGGIFTDARTAEDTCQKMNDEQARIALIPNPVPDAEFYDGMDEKIFKQWEDWERENSFAREWNKATVCEYELNKTY